MFGIGFLQPAFLAGILAAGIPIALHLLGKRRLAEYPFSTIELLSKSLQESRRRSRIQELLLLAIRTLILILLSLAMARPAATGGAATQSSATPVLFVFDNSPSMARAESGATRFDIAKARLLQSLRLLDGQREVTVFLTHGPDPFVVHRRQVRDLDLADLSHRIRRSAMPAISRHLGELKRLTAKSDGMVGLVIVVTDAQQNVLEPLAAAYHESGARWQVLLSGPESGGSDTGVATLSVIPEAPVVGAPVTVRVTFAGDGAPASGELWAGDQVVAGTSGTAPRTDTLNLTWTPEHPGVFPLTFSSDTDAFPLNNLAFAAVNVTASRPVLISVPEGVTRPVMNVVLDPSGNRGAGPVSPYLASVRPQPALDSILLGDYAAVVLEDFAPPYEDFRPALEDYVRGGGTVILLPGERFDPHRFAEVFGGSNSIFPQKLEGPAAEGANSLLPVQIDSRFDFSGTSRESGLLLARFAIAKWWRFGGVPGAAPVMLGANGDPLIVLNQAGEGTTVLSALSPAAEWSGLLSWRGVLPFMHTLLARVTDRPRVPAVLTWGGASLSSALVEGSPAGWKWNAPPLTSARVSPALLEELGIGFLRDAGEDRLLAMNLAAGEGTDPSLSPGQVGELLPGVEISSLPAAGDRSIGSGPADLPVILLGMMLVLLLAETAIANLGGGLIQPRERLGLEAESAK